MIKLLLELGANPQAQNVSGYLPIDYAIVLNDKETALNLIKFGAINNIHAITELKSYEPAMKKGYSEVLKIVSDAIGKK